MTYKDLTVWQQGMSLAKEIYNNIIPKLPRYETFGLSDQIRRAAISVPSNIAEGHARDTTKEYLKFLSYAKGSLAELQTQLLLCTEFDYVTKTDIDSAMQLSEELMKKLNNLILTLKEKL